MTLQSNGAADEEIRRLGPWFHNLHLPDGTQTAPDHPFGDFPAFKWAELAPALPADLDGCRTLEIGCNAGYYAFELAKRGADVLAVDHDEHYLRQARWAQERFTDLPGKVEFRRLGVYDLGGLDETFDLVLFMGVLYHLRYPLLGLDLVAERVRGTLVLQTLTLPGDEVVEAPAELDYVERERMLERGWPVAAFVEHRYAGDPTNWWLPNAAAVEAMVRSAGLRVVARPGEEMWLCEPAGWEPDRSELRAATGR